MAFTVPDQPVLPRFCPSLRETLLHDDCFSSSSTIPAIFSQLAKFCCTFFSFMPEVQRRIRFGNRILRLPPSGRSVAFGFLGASRGQASEPTFLSCNRTCVSCRAFHSVVPILLSCSGSFSVSWLRASGLFTNSTTVFFFHFNLHGHGQVPPDGFSAFYVVMDPLLEPAKSQS